MHTQIIEGGIELIDRIEPLWSKLNAHHSSISPFFTDDFRQFKFETRKKDLVEKADAGRLRLVLSISDNILHGYCIASIFDKEGEIDSIFVEEEFRTMGIGSSLIKTCIDWLYSQKVERIKVGVVFGNENAYAFYARFGLLPRVTYLTTRNWHS